MSIQDGRIVCDSCLDVLEVREGWTLDRQHGHDYCPACDIVGTATKTDEDKKESEGGLSYMGVIVSCDRCKEKTSLGGDFVKRYECWKRDAANRPANMLSCELALMSTPNARQFVAFKWLCPTCIDIVSGLLAQIENKTP